MQSHCSLREAKSDDITLVSVSSARFVISLSTGVAIKKQYHSFAATARYSIFICIASFPFVSFQLINLPSA
jgi:hypothetical protein